jgi:hypothetical protein
MEPTPATNGAKVRTMGTNRARTIVFLKKKKKINRRKSTHDRYEPLQDDRSAETKKKKEIRRIRQDRRDSRQDNRFIERTKNEM